MGAGILPVAFRQGKAYFLFARERIGTKSRDSGRWSDFGGKTEKGESHTDTAIREAWEESMGLLGSKQDLLSRMKTHGIGEVDMGFYKTYLVEIDYNERFPDIFKATFENAPDSLVTARNGLYEKDAAMWVPVTDVGRFARNFRIWYKKSGIPFKAAKLVKSLNCYHQ